MNIAKLKYLLENNIFLFRELSYLRLRGRCLSDHSLGEYYLNRFLPRDFSDKKNKDFKIIDIGCSWGRFGALLSKQGLSVYGIDTFIDQSKFWVDIRKENKTAYFTAADVQQVPFKKGVFDGCIMIGVLEFIKEADLFFSELKRVLKPGGVFVLQVANRDNIYTRITGQSIRKDYRRYYSKEEALALLGKHGFSVFNIAGEGWDLPIIGKIASVFSPYFATLSYRSNILTKVLPLKQQTFLTFFARKNG